ncbi:MAG: HlyD family efflux transporter periplasmic adaptor subunit [Patescibacteria group bacterium]
MPSSDDDVTPQTVRDAYDDAVSQLKSAAQILTDGVRDADNVIGTDNTGANDAYEHQLSVLDASKLAMAQSAYGNAKNLAASYKVKADALLLSGESLNNIQSAIDDAEKALEAIDPLLQYTSEALQYTIPSSAFTQNSIDGLRNTINNDRSNAVSKRSSIATINRSIENAKTTYANAQSKVASAQIALDKLKAGATASEIATAEERLASAKLAYEDAKTGLDSIDKAIQLNGIEQRRASVTEAYSRLSDAQETLSNYDVKAPFDGVVAKLEVQKATAVSPSTAMAVLLTKAKIATVTLNEVDVTKVKVGQKATLSFDAVSDLTIAGTVTEVDMIGTTSQNVVSYTVKIAFLTEDDRIKPGMSVSASIISERKDNVLMVPNSAVKAVNDVSVVQTAKVDGITNPTSASGVELKGELTSKTVTTGLANDEYTEVTTGVNEGDYVLVRTILPSATTAKTTTSGTASTNQLLRAASGGGGFQGPPNR